MWFPTHNLPPALLPPFGAANMSINFSTHEIGRRALRSSQLGLALTGQNISNINTPGYTRRGLEHSLTQLPGAGLRPVSESSIEGVRNFRDNFLEQRINAETASNGRFTAQYDALAPVEAALSETGGGSIAGALESFFGAFRDLDANPSSVTQRGVVVQQGTVLANAFHTTSGRLDQIRRETDQTLRATVEETNDLAEKVAYLNGRLKTASGPDVFELRDQRNEYARQLAELSGARSVPNQDGTITLTLGDGRALVAGTEAKPLTLVDTPPNGLATIQINGQPTIFSDGKIAGLQDALGKIGDQFSDLDDLAASVADRVNTLHASGTDLDDAGGLAFFVSANAQPLAAANITVNPALKANARLVVASPLAQPAAAGTVAGALANLLHDTNSQVGAQTGSFSSIYGSFIAEAGTNVRRAEDSLSLQAAILAQAAAQQQSISGVSLDEEAINLLQYQRAIEAAAKFLKIADEITQTTIALGQ
jgi:flagellar hook-associated protein 1 FlgK